MGTVGAGVRSEGRRRNPDNFFAETEQVAFHPGYIVPGIDINNTKRACYKCLHSSELSLCSTPPGPADALLAVGEVSQSLFDDCGEISWVELVEA